MDIIKTQQGLDIEERMVFEALKEQAATLIAESEQRKAALLQIQTDMAALRARYERGEAEGRRMIQDLSRKHGDQVQAGRRANASLLESLRAIDALLKALTGSNMETARHYFPGEVYRAMQDANEVLKAYGIPF